MMRRIIVLLALCAVVFLGCTENVAKQVSVAEFENLMSEESSIQIIDVRTPNEYAQGYIKNSQLMNFNSADFKTQITTLDKNKPVAVYCHSGARSNQAFEIMKEMGFRQIYELQGGMVAWQQNGKQVLK